FDLYILFICIFFFFFFQAEDGIRDRTVTGVQTCALPICNTFDQDGCDSNCRLELGYLCSDGEPTICYYSGDCSVPGVICSASPRSEERRVGKECRSRWGADQ